MGITLSDYRSMLARLAMAKPTARTAGVEDERELHEEILSECRRRGWLVFHGSMAHSTHRTPGEPDFVILTDGGRTLLVEAKTRTGKLSTDQLAVQAWARKLGHHVHVVRSLEEFIRAVSANGAPL